MTYVNFVILIHFCKNNTKRQVTMTDQKNNFKIYNLLL